ncbi:MAG: hypothetical protein QFB86_00035 [Patescibacteria group bacterium]|nr:hypothetical protein [Patescibacteria group bacterium]
MHISAVAADSTALTSVMAMQASSFVTTPHGYSVTFGHSADRCTGCNMPLGSCAHTDEDILDRPISMMDSVVGAFDRLSAPQRTRCTRAKDKPFKSRNLVHAINSAYRTAPRPRLV